MSESNNNNSSGQPKKKLTPNPGGLQGWVVAALILAIMGLVFFNSSNKLGSVPYKTFEKMVLEGDVQKVFLVKGTNSLEINLTPTGLAKPEYKTKLANNKFSAGPHLKVDIVSEDSFMNEYISFLKTSAIPDDVKNNLYPETMTRSDYMNIFWQWFPILFFFGLMYFIMTRMSGGGPGGALFNIGKSKAALFDADNKVKITFQDVAGLDEAKEELTEIVEFLKKPGKYTELGGKIPKGALLVGPPGTGKTLMAKAVAGEASVPFFSLSGSDFVEMFVGVGAARVRDLFKQAKEKSPSIIFIDEIDAVGRARGKNAMSGANDERESTLNQLLTEMDGFGTNTAVIVLAATNRAEILDKALLRAGRFDRQIYVDLPDLNERKQIFDVHLKPIKKVENLDLDFLAKQTPGFSGADIANVCNEAALTAARKNKESVDRQDFLDAVDRIIGGLEKKNKIITPAEKKAIAVHEAGHATVSWLLEHAAPLIKVTIVPRGQSLGAAWYLPEERQIVRGAQMLDEMCATMGGRAAEKSSF